MYLGIGKFFHHVAAPGSSNITRCRHKRGVAIMMVLSAECKQIVCIERIAKCRIGEAAMFDHDRNTHKL